MPSRTNAREQALQILFFMDMSKTNSDQALSLFTENFKNDPGDFPFVRNLVEGVEKNCGNLDALISEFSDHWKPSRMPRIDRNILRLGTYEICHTPEVPSAVAIDEAIELGKKYGESDTGLFVNGILDRISKKVRTA